jgi:biotin carboxyl carrier protein
MREYKLALNGNDYTVSITSVSDEEVVAEVNGKTHIVAIKEIRNSTAVGQLKTLPEPASRDNSSLVSPVVNTTGSMLAKAGMVVSPIPGHILEVCVAVGDKVLVGQKLLVLEAMKLENAITSEGAGVVKKILVASGDAVTHGQNMIEIG